MARISEGDLDHKLAERSNDELGRMGASFNQMTDQLQSTYRRVRREQNKITTVIETANEGIVVTDATRAIVLVNPAATFLLDKKSDALVAQGYDQVVDDADFIAHCLETGNPQAIRYKLRDLQVIATEIRSSEKEIIGTVILIRDVTEEKRLEEDLRRTSTTDALTGLYNRRFLDATLNAEFVRSERSLVPLSVLMMDIDHFKKFNDTHGHDQGDRVLQMVARVMREQVRSFDFPCRYGGEEYVAILPGMSSDAACQVAEAIRIKVAETEVDGLHVQLSIGVATFPGIAAAKSEALIEAADAALYRAKETGRNRVTVAVELS
jgi:diguanylate cyclase (GGDEF)-like protein/PAS domain S-box-containing protein